MKQTLKLCWLALCLAFFAAGCSPSLPPEAEPDPTKAPPTAMPVTATVGQPALEAATAYPEPIAEPVEKREGYPEPPALAQVVPYPSPPLPTPTRVAQQAQLAATERLVPKVINVYPHDRTVFTQGLAWADGSLYESGGLVGQSAVYQVDVQTGELVQRVAADPNFFAEGIALVDDKIIMLTWQSQTAVVYDRETFAEVGRFDYVGQGWGLCYDESSRQLWMSDGSNKIVSRDPTTFEIIGEIAVTLNGNPISQINELECVHGIIYANIWKSDTIIAIDRFLGVVQFEIDASNLLTPEERSGLVAGRQVLNGIAYNPETGRFFLTGKQWPKLFEVEFVGE